MLLRGAVDAIVRGCPAVVIPGYSRMVVLIRDYQAFLAEHTRLTVDVCSNGPSQGIDAISHEGARASSDFSDARQSRSTTRANSKIARAGRFTCGLNLSHPGWGMRPALVVGLGI